MGFGPKDEITGGPECRMQKKERKKQKERKKHHALNVVLVSESTLVN